jgi:hypothetical protein
MQCTSVFIGSALIHELRASDKMTMDGARAWIVRKTGHGFDPEAMYQIRWQNEEDSPTWSGYADIQVHIMTDPELLQLERDYRSQHRLPQRRPWESPMYRAAMGRSDGPRRSPGSRH